MKQVCFVACQKQPPSSCVERQVGTHACAYTRCSRKKSSEQFLKNSKLVKIYSNFLKNTSQLACQLCSSLNFFTTIFNRSCLDFQTTIFQNISECLLLFFQLKYLKRLGETSVAESIFIINVGPMQFCLKLHHPQNFPK